MPGAALQLGGGVFGTAGPSGGRVAPLAHEPNRSQNMAHVTYDICVTHHQIKWSNMVNILFV